LGVNAVFAGLVGEPQFELVVDAGFAGGIGALDDVADVAEGLDDLLDGVFGERRAVGGWPGGGAGQDGGSLGGDGSGPSGDGDGVSSGVERGLVAGELGVTFGDERGTVICGDQRCGLGAVGGSQFADRLREAVGGEDFREPAVDGGQKLFFADVDVDGCCTWLARAYSLA